MKLILAACCVAVLSSASLAAQKTETTTTSKVTVTGGKEVKVTGCVEPMAGGKGFVLSNVADKAGALHDYVLLSDDADLSKHIGHRLQVSGKAADRGDAKVETETKTKTDVEDGKDQKTRTRSQQEGNLPDALYLSVTSVKMIAAVCP